MKVSNLIKQLKNIQKEHGNIDMVIPCNYTGKYYTITGTQSLHPYSDNGSLRDRNKNVYAIALVTDNKTSK